MTNMLDGVCGHERVGFSRLAIRIAVLQLYRITSLVLREEVGKESSVLGEGSVLVFSQATYTMFPFDISLILRQRRGMGIILFFSSSTEAYFNHAV